MPICAATSVFNSCIRSKQSFVDIQVNSFLHSEATHSIWFLNAIIPGNQLVSESSCSLIDDKNKKHLSHSYNIKSELQMWKSDHKVAIAASPQDLGF